MSKYDYDAEDDLSGTVRTDLAFASTFSMSFLYFATLILLIPLLILANIPKKTQAQKPPEVAMAKLWGDIMITIEWPEKKDIDIDLWSKSPDDSLPIGYSRPRGITLSLLKDVTGIGPQNPTGRMREIVLGDGMPDGRYTVNVHLYRNGSNLMEVPVDIEVLAVDGNRTVTILKKRVILIYSGQERTVANFAVERGKLKGKPDEQNTPLRAAGGGGSP